MKSYLFTLVIFLAIAAEKYKREKEEIIPACIQQKIDRIKRNQNARPTGRAAVNPPAEVHEYSYNGKRVFYFGSNCCDQYNVVYDENCEQVLPKCRK